MVRADAALFTALGHYWTGMAQIQLADLEKNDRYIVSLKTLKKTEDIEKLAKNIRGRLKRY